MESNTSITLGAIAIGIAIGVISSFLPKFENNDKIFDKGGKHQWHCASIKYSGSLGMFAGLHSGFIYSFAKNSVNNMYTHLPTIMLKGYFDAMFPADSNAFHNFATTVYDMGLTISFEFVVPIILGQHGGTPNMPHFALTAITSSGDDPLTRKIWNIAQILRFATIYKLPVAGGAIFTNGADIEPIIQSSKYHWLSRNIENFLASASMTSWGVQPDYLLSHTVTQGDKCEGLVVQTFEMDSEESLNSITESICIAAEMYNTVMEECAPAANEYFRSLNGRILNINSKGININSTEIFNWYREAVPYKQPENIQLPEECNLDVIRQLSLSSQMYANLFNLYGLQVRIRYYKCDSDIFAQMQIKNDSIFGSMSLLHPDQALPRGLVFRVGKLASSSEDAITASSITDIMQMAIPLVVVYRIAKIKCLAYIICTFAIRNQFRNITRNITSNQHLIGKFLQNWSIPKEFHHAVTKYLHEVYSKFSTMDENTRKEKYLEVVEEFFNTPHPNNVELRALFGYSNDMSECKLLHMPNLLVLSLGDMGSSKFQSTMGIVPASFVNNLPSLGKDLEGKCIIILSSSTDNNQKKIDGIAKTLRNKRVACVLVDPKNKQDILNEIAPFITATATSTTATSTTATPITATPTTAELPPLYIAAFLGFPIASGKSTITSALLELVPNSVSVSKEGSFTSDFIRNISASIHRSDIKLIIVNKNHPDKNGFDATLSVILQALGDSQRQIIFIPIVSEKLEDYTILEDRIRARTGKSSSEVGGSTFIPETKGLEDGKWQSEFRTTFYDLSANFLNMFKRISGALIVDVIHTSPEENAHIIADKILSEEPVGAPLSDIISPKVVHTFTGINLEDVVGGAHVTLHHTTKGPAPECIETLIGQEVTVVFTKYVSAKKDDKTIKFWMVDSIHFKDTGEVIELPDSNLFHITDQAALRNTNSANAFIAKEVMKEIRENDDLAKSESSRCDEEVLTPKWEYEIILSSGKVSGIIKRM